MSYDNQIKTVHELLKFSSEKNTKNDNGDINLFFSAQCSVMIDGSISLNRTFALLYLLTLCVQLYGAYYYKGHLITITDNKDRDKILFSFDLGTILAVLCCGFLPYVGKEIYEYRWLVDNDPRKEKNE